MEIPNEKGVYVLVLHLNRKIKLRVGSLSYQLFKPGYYYYVGSALGPGGLRARIYRHLRSSKKVRWHIDYLTVNQLFKPVLIVYAYSTERIECNISLSLLSRGFKPYIRKFGSFDCRSCPTHLYYAKELNLEKVIEAFIENHLNPRIKFIKDS
ncbi:MAG TPA: GIY-YIG nuclease family protein [Thermoprotei archaeon]|nr:GIY-YIG nuclease family protein [Thermoprotei archaeon]